MNKTKSPVNRTKTARFRFPPAHWLSSTHLNSLMFSFPHKLLAGRQYNVLRYQKWLVYDFQAVARHRRQVGLWAKVWQGPAPCSHSRNISTRLTCIHRQVWIGHSKTCKCMARGLKIETRLISKNSIQQQNHNVYPPHPYCCAKNYPCHVLAH